MVCNAIIFLKQFNWCSARSHFLLFMNLWYITISISIAETRALVQTTVANDKMKLTCNVSQVIESVSQEKCFESIRSSDGNALSYETDLSRCTLHKCSNQGNGIPTEFVSSQTITALKPSILKRSKFSHISMLNMDICISLKLSQTIPQMRHVTRQ